MISAQYPGLCHSVVSHDGQAAELLVKHLISLGHRRFGWLGGNSKLQRGKERLRAFVETLENQGIELDRRFILEEEGGGRMIGRNAAERLLKKVPRAELPTALLTYNSHVARGALNYFLQKGFEVPRDISIASCDRSGVLTEEFPSITGASADPEKMGRVAAEILMKEESSQQENFATIIIPAEIVVGESTGVAP